jgi:hypothetical protein
VKRNAAAKKPAAKKPAAKKPAARKSAPKSAAKKTAARKSAPKPAAKKSAARKSAPKPAAKKAAARKPARRVVGSRAPAATAGSSPSALGALAKILGPAEPRLLEALLAGTSDEHLIEVGRKIASSKVVDDCVRLYQHAHKTWQELPPAKRALLRGFSPALLALGVEQAAELERLDALNKDSSAADAAYRDAVDGTLARELSPGLLLRDQAYDALRQVAGTRPQLRAAIEQAVGTAETPEALARGLSSLAEVLGRWLELARSDSALAGRLVLASLDATYVTELRDKARTIRAAAASAKDRPAVIPATAAQLNRADGLNVLILGQIVRAFERGHDRDPAIPALIPITTRRILGLSRRAQPAAKPTPAPAGEGKKPA